MQTLRDSRSILATALPWIVGLLAVWMMGRCFRRLLWRLAGVGWLLYVLSGGHVLHGLF